MMNAVGLMAAYAAKTDEQHGLLDCSVFLRR
jgi:hypothetical protein